MVFANTCVFYIGSLTDDRFVALYQHFIMTAKTTPYPFCHRDNIQAKAPRMMAGWLHRVTLTNYTAGPLWASHSPTESITTPIIPLSCNFTTYYENLLYHNRDIH
jgi:hypothetical protein